MPSKLWATLGLLLFVAAPVCADDSEARAIVDKAIKALGGETELAKWKAMTCKIKGEIHTQGLAIPFAGELATQGADQEKIALDLSVEGQQFQVVHVLNRTRGWVKIAGQLVEMDKEQLTEAIEQAHVGWVSSLLPLNDKAFTLATLGEIRIDEKPAVGVRVSHAGRRDANLYFDKSTHLVVKIEARVKDEDSGKEMTEETFMSGYDGKDVQTALKITVNRDGELYLKAELFDVKLEKKLDDSVFAMP